MKTGNTKRSHRWIWWIVVWSILSNYISKPIRLYCAGKITEEQFNILLPQAIVTAGFMIALIGGIIHLYYVRTGGEWHGFRIKHGGVAEENSEDTEAGDKPADSEPPCDRPTGVAPGNTQPPTC